MLATSVNVAPIHKSIVLLDDEFEALSHVHRDGGRLTFSQAAHVAGEKERVANRRRTKPHAIA